MAGCGRTPSGGLQASCCTVPWTQRPTLPPLPADIWKGSSSLSLSSLRAPPPLLAEMAGSTYFAPVEAIRTAIDTRSPSRLLRLMDQGVASSKSARGINFTANGLVHLEATELLQTQTPSHVMDAGLRGALGRSACTLQNLVSVESPAVGDRIHLALTGSTISVPATVHLV